MLQPRVEGVLVDVGGTLWPNDLVLNDELRAEREERLAAVLQIARTDRFARIIDDIEATPLLRPDEARDEWVRRGLAGHGIRVDLPTARRARQALSTPLPGVLEPFDDAAEMLSGFRGLGLRVVVLRNTAFRDAELYRADFEALGWAGYVDGYVTSVEVGISKPDVAMFEAAVAAAAVPMASCVMLGDTETADIAPAVALGMRAILAAIDKPPPASTAAQVCITSLADVVNVIRKWI